MEITEPNNSKKAGRENHSSGHGGHDDHEEEVEKSGQDGWRKGQLSEITLGKHSNWNANNILCGPNGDFEFACRFSNKRRTF